MLHIPGSISVPDDVSAFKLPELGPENVALMCMTSGTTGVPKAVMHTQGGLAFSCYDVMDATWYNAGMLRLPKRVDGDCVPIALALQTGYISGYLVLMATLTLHMTLNFCDVDEMRGFIKGGWPAGVLRVMCLATRMVLCDSLMVMRERKDAAACARRA
jgi:acyl-CoA synthetase (AMP-forming)/AMP-acid ligase II